MTPSLETSLTDTLGSAARAAGLHVLSIETGTDFHQKPTARFHLGLTANASAAHSLLLELSDAFDFHQVGSNGDELLPAMTLHLREAASRLRNPRPDAYVTVAGLPISLGEFAWPFHRSTTGADTYIVHGVVRLEDGSAPILHAKISASMTVTFAEIVPAPEQPYAETFIYNAVRKTLDYGQLELVKSGNRQPVPLTTRYYSAKQKKFVFNDTTDEQRKDFLACKAYWLSGVLGAGAPVWVLDPRDAQYLDATAEELRRAAESLIALGLLEAADDGFAAATPKLMERRDLYAALQARTLESIKPSFNEEMRSGLTNM